MKCEEVRDEMVAYARGELTEARRVEIEEHLVRCEGCTREIEGTRQILALTSTADEASVIALTHEIVRRAIADGATDIHLEPMSPGSCDTAAGGPAGRVRIRVDGVLCDLREMDRDQMDPVVARLKLMAGLKLTERSIPQDGRIAIRAEGKEYDLRVSVLPYFHGEAAVIRVLDRSSVLIGLDRLGFLPEVMQPFESLVRSPDGLVLVTGPTGSGKTTTLYSVLNLLNRQEVKIVTIEDPVEYLLGGVNQAAVNRRAGMTFATALRAFLRQDPDIVMVGEVRDLETAEIAVEAALTGRLVMTCLHTRDATETITRLVDIGIEPFLIASTLRGALAQRLTRRVCTECGEPYAPTSTVLGALGIPVDQAGSFRRGAGCASCHGTGYRGRCALTELLVMNEDLAHMVSSRAPEAELRERALEMSALWTFREDGRQKVIAGITTAEEVERNLDGVPAVGS